jgi:hypothetical protein
MELGPMTFLWFLIFVGIAVAIAVVLGGLAARFLMDASDDVSRQRTGR